MKVGDTYRLHKPSKFRPFNDNPVVCRDGRSPGRGADGRRHANEFTFEQLEDNLAYALLERGMVAVDEPVGREQFSRDLAEDVRSVIVRCIRWPEGM